MIENSEHPLALPVGTELVGDYVITKVLGAGGFGITYEARERSLDRIVAIKEYFPVDIVEREGWALVKSRSKTLDIKYARGLRRFIEEAKAITQFNHPNIVRVLRYFKSNNTAFMVLHYEAGVDMGVWRENLDRPPGEHQLEAIISPLLDALELIHDNDFLHRDIAPDNIIIRKDGSPILIDFGSARSELTFSSKTVSALVKSGYSPFEQYAKNSKEQGPWTDIYSFGATLYQMVTGEAPPDSLSRLALDEIIPAKKRSKKHYSRDFLAGIDSALEIKIADRPQSIDEWRAMLFPAGTQALQEQQSSEGTRQPLSGLRRRPVEKPAPEAKEKRTKAHHPGMFSKKTGQSSVAGLIAKAGLKSVDLGENAARLAEKVKAPLRKLVPRGGHRPPPPKNITPPPASPASDDPQGPAPRSLRSLLNELDHRSENAGHEEAIEKAANALPASATAPLSSPEKKKAARFARLAPGKIFKTAQQSLARLRFPAFITRKRIAALAVLALLVTGFKYFPADLKEIPGKIELPPVLKNPADLFARTQESLIRTIDAHENGVTTLRLADKGRQLVSVGADQIIKIWHMEDGTLFRSYVAHDQTISGLDIKGERLVRSDSSGNISLFDIRNSIEIASFSAYQKPVQSIAFGSRGNDLVSGNGQGQLDYWDFKNDAYSRRSFRGEGHSGQILAIVSHKRYIVSGSADNTARIWSRSRKKLIRTYRGHSAPVTALALSPKAYRLATGSKDDSIKIWSPKSRRLRRTIKAGQGGVLALAFAKNGKWLASGGVDHSIKIWNARNGKFIRSLEGHDKPVRALLFSRDTKTLLSAGDDETIRMWDWNKKLSRK